MLQVQQNGAFLIQRNLRIYSSTGGNVRPTIDFAYLGGTLRLQPGNTFTFDGAHTAYMCALTAHRQAIRYPPTLMAGDCLADEAVLQLPTAL